MRILGLDLSLRETGCIVMDQKDNRVLSDRSIRTPIRLRGMKRIDHIIEEIRQPLGSDDPKTSIKVVVIEGYSYNSRGMNFNIGELGGCVKLYLFKNEIPFLIISPTQLKKYATNSGNCPKEKVIQCVNRKWNQNFTNNNQADAYVLARIGCDLLNVEHLTNRSDEYKYEIDVIEKITDENNPEGTLDVIRMEHKQ